MHKRSRLERIFVWPDTHTPYQDPIAVAVALKALRAFNPHRVVILGDFFDFYAVSFYAKDPRRKALLADELADGQETADRVAKATSGADVTFLEGNHEHRLGRYIKEKAPALEGLTKKVQDLIPQEWAFLPYGQALKLGRMYYSHDFGRSGDRATVQGLQDVGKNICFGHTHQLHIATIGQLGGNPHVAVNCGWLGGLQHIDYKHQSIARRRYQHGFGLVYQDSSGNVWPQGVPIVNRSCVIEGKRVAI